MIFNNKVEQKFKGANASSKSKSFRITKDINGKKPVVHNASKKVSFSKSGKQTVRIRIHCGAFFAMSTTQNIKTDKTTTERSRGPMLKYLKAKERPDIADYVNKWYTHYPKTKPCPDPMYSAPQEDGSTIVMEHLEPSKDGAPRFRYVAKDTPVYLTRISPKTMTFITEDEVQEYMKNREEMMKVKNNPMMAGSKPKFVRNWMDADDTNWYYEVSYPESNYFPFDLHLGCVVGREVVDGKQSDELKLYLAASNGEQPYTSNGFIKNTGAGTFSAGSFSRWILKDLPIGEAIENKTLNYGEVNLDRRVDAVYVDHYKRVIGKHSATDKEADIILYEISGYSFKRDANKKIIKAKKAGKVTATKTTIELSEDTDI